MSKISFLVFVDSLGPITVHHLLAALLSLSFFAISAREHFVVHHWSQLKRRLSTLDPVLDDLKAQNLITREQCVNLHTQETFEEKMTEFHNVVTSWPEADKDKLYLSLRKHNYSIIKELEKNDKKVNKHSSGKSFFNFPIITVHL